MALAHTYRAKEREREREREEKSKEGNYSQGGISINNIIKGTEEDAKQTESDQQSRGHRDRPVNLRLEARPAKPEQARRKGDTANDRRGHAPFGNRDSMIRIQFAIVRGLGQDDVDATADLANHETPVRKAGHTGGEAMNRLKDDGVRGEKEVEEPVQEGHVDTQEEDNGFEEEQLDRTEEVLLDEFPVINFDFFLFGVDAPI